MPKVSSLVAARFTLEGSFTTKGKMPCGMTGFIRICHNDYRSGLVWPLGRSSISVEPFQVSETSEYFKQALSYKTALSTQQLIPQDVQPE